VHGYFRREDGITSLWQTRHLDSLFGAAWTSIPISALRSHETTADSSAKTLVR